MKFNETPLKGAFTIELDRRVDDRGFFARTFCVSEFSQYGLATNFVQMSLSHNHEAGQVRGMHYQAAPHAETKVVRCVRGAVFDVMVDLREGSLTYGRSHGEILSAENGRCFYIPKGFAHGYKVLTDDTDLLYMMDEYYHPESAKEISPETLGIDWSRS